MVNILFIIYTNGERNRVSLACAPYNLIKLLIYQGVDLSFFTVFYLAYSINAYKIHMIYIDNNVIVEMCPIAVIL